MFSRLWNLIKSHPILSVVVIVAVVGIVILATRRKDSAAGMSATGTNMVIGGAGADPNATALQALQAQLNSEAAKMGSLERVELAKLDTSLAMATIGAQSQFQLTEINAALMRDRYNAELAAQTTMSTLASNVQIAGINAQKDVALAGNAIATKQIDSNVQIAKIIAANQNNCGPFRRFFGAC